MLPSSVSSSTDELTWTHAVGLLKLFFRVSQSSLNSLEFDSHSLYFEDLEAEPEEPELHTESDLSISTGPSLVSLLASSMVSISKYLNLLTVN